MQAKAPAGDSSYWSLIQLLLVLATLAAVLLVPSLMALVPNFNGHILPTAPHKVRHSTSHDACIMHESHCNAPKQECEVRCMPQQGICCLL